jgi:molybdate transport system permease protein
LEELMDMTPLWISLKVASMATIFTFFLGIIIAGFITFKSRVKHLADGFFSLPLVLPPTVVGFILLIIFGKNSSLGKVLLKMGINVIFTWQGAVIASVIISFPVMYRTLRGAFEQVDKNLIHAGMTLGLSEFKIFRKIIISEAWPGVVAATVLSFARALGEFGATIMIAGNIPGRTQTMPIAIYTAMQSGDRSLALKWVCFVSVFSIIILFIMNFITEKFVKR